MSKKNILLHVHIFKNAGSSFDNALHHFFAKGFVDHRDDKDLINKTRVEDDFERR